MTVAWRQSCACHVWANLQKTPGRSRVSFTRAATRGQNKYPHHRTSLSGPGPASGFELRGSARLYNA